MKLFLLIDKSVHIYEINGGNSITMKKKIMLSGPVTDVSYSPDGKYLVSADGNRKGKQYIVSYLNNNLSKFMGEIYGMSR